MLDGWPLVRSGELLYQNDIGSDACGIGGIASKDGAPCREVVRKSLAAVASMEHRGGVCGETGDGTGLTCVLPQARSREEGHRGVGTARRHRASSRSLDRGAGSSSPLKEECR